MKVNKRRRHIAYVLLAATDAAIIICSYLLVSKLYTASLESLGGLNQLKLPLWYSSGMVALIAFAIFLSICYVANHVYRALYLGQMKLMIRRIIVVNAVGIMLFIVVLFVLHMDDVSRMTLLLFYLVSTILVSLKNYLAYRLLLWVRRRYKVRRLVLLVGSGPLAQRYAKVMTLTPLRLETIVGYVDSAKATSDHSEPPGEGSYLGKYLGSVSDIDRILEENRIEEIVIALESGEYNEMLTISAAADKHGTALTLVPFYNDAIPRMPQMDSLQGVNLINLRSIPLDSNFNAFVKRASDIVLSLFVIVITSWLMVIAAVGVRLSSPGPILFFQDRTGKNGHNFQMYKFRSMRMADDPVSTFTEDKDARKTKFGSFIRKYSIDELPQFFNVLKGDMSIIGPRPVVVEETEVYRNIIPLYMLRHQVRPGISGWAQIHGFRGGTQLDQIEQRTKYDLWYVQNWTMGLDARIFFRTLFGGFINDEKL